AEDPPVALAPGVVALPDAVELDGLVADQDPPVDPARHLVAGRARRGGVDAAGDLPLEVEAEGHPLAPGPAGLVDLGRVVDPQAEGLAPEGHVVEGGLDRVVGPQALRAHLQGPGRRQRDLVVDHRHELPALPHDAGPVPGDALVRVEPAAPVAAQRTVGRGEVEVPRLVPPRLGPRLVVALVAGVEGGRPPCRGLRHGPSMARGPGAPPGYGGPPRAGAAVACPRAVPEPRVDGR